MAALCDLPRPADLRHLGQLRRRRRGQLSKLATSGQFNPAHSQQWCYPQRNLHRAGACYLRLAAKCDHITAHSSVKLRKGVRAGGRDRASCGPRLCLPGAGSALARWDLCPASGEEGVDLRREPRLCWAAMVSAAAPWAWRELISAFSPEFSSGPGAGPTFCTPLSSRPVYLGTPLLPTVQIAAKAYPWLEYGRGEAECLHRQRRGREDYGFLRLRRSERTESQEPGAAHFQRPGAFSC